MLLNARFTLLHRTDQLLLCSVSVWYTWVRRTFTSAKKIFYNASYNLKVQKLYSVIRAFSRIRS